MKDEIRIKYFFKKLSGNKYPTSWLKFLFDEDFFAPEQSPKPKRKGNYYNIPYWNVIPYLESASEANSENPNIDTSKLLKKIIEENCEYIKKLKPEDRNYSTSGMILKLISNLPKENITKNIIEKIHPLLDDDFNDDHLAYIFNKKIFRKVVETKKEDLIVRLFEISIDYKINKKSPYRKKEISSILGEYYFKEFVKNNAKLIPSNCHFRCLLSLIRLIKKIHKQDDFAFRLFSILDADNSSLSFSEDYVFQIICITKNLIDTDSMKKEKQIKNIMDELKETEISLLRQIKTYLGGIHFAKMNSFIWEHVVDNKVLDYQNRREACDFFKKNLFQFTPIQLDKITTLIENIKPKYIKDKSKREKEEAGLKRGWLSIFLPLKNEKMLRLYEDYGKITPWVQSLEHPAILIEVKSGAGPSPFKHKELSGLSAENLVKKISDYVEEERLSANDFSKEGLAYELVSVINDNPSKYVKGFKSLLNLDFFYLYHVITGLNKAKKENKAFPLNVLLSEIFDYLKNIYKWPEENDSEYSYAHGFMKETFYLIEREISSENTCVRKSELDLIREILICSLKKNPPYRTTNDNIGSLIFSLFGSLFNCTIAYLKVIKEKNNSSRLEWDRYFKDIFNNKLSDLRRDRAFSVNLGRQLNYLLYLDQKWVLQNFNKICPIDSEHETEWKDAISGFFSHWREDIFNEIIYNKMKDGRHLKKAIQAKFATYEVNSIIVTYICYAYFCGFESYKNGLISQLIELKDNIRIQEIIGFFVDVKTATSIDKKSRIKEIWNKIFDIYKEQIGRSENSDSKEIVVNLNRLQKHFDNISESYPKLKYSFKFLKREAESFNLKILEKFVRQEPDLVAQLMIVTIQNDFYFYYCQDEVKNILTVLDAKGEQSRANGIREAYTKKYLFLDD